MQVFEFHFNPKAKEDVIYDSFVFEPENTWERKMGKLYMVGHLSNALPQNLRFLENLSSQIKKEYYRVTERQPEIALRESLKKANEFLSQEVKNGNVSWLGNFDFAVLSLKNGIINFTTTGDISLFILREGQITDINQTLRLQEIEPYPLKIFSNIVSGKFTVGDKVVTLTKEVSEFFDKENLLNSIAKLETIEEKKIRKIFQDKEALSLKLSGICFLIDITEQDISKERITFGEKILPFSTWQAFFSFPGKTFRKLLLKLKKPQIRPEIPQRLRIPALKLPGFNINIRLPKINISLVFKRNSILVLALIIILLLGGFLANLEQQKGQKEAKVIIEEVKEKIQLAQSALAQKDKGKANLIYQEAWDKIFPLAKTDSPVENEAIELKNSIESQLIPLNNLKKINNPEVVFDFEDLDFIPQKIVSFDSKLYLFNSYFSNIYELKPGEKKGNLIKTEEKFNFGASSDETEWLLLFSRPNKLFSFSGNQFRQAFFLKDPYPDYQFDDFSVYKTYLYFLDKKKGEILKYIFDKNRLEFQGSIWFNPETEKPTEIQSLAVDGSVWIITKGNSIERFYTGYFQETLELNFFPYPKKFSRLFTTSSLPYLYLSDPMQNRIIILDKSGKMIQQFQSNKFNNLKDFAVSKNGRTVYLLNGLKVYKVDF